MQIKSWQIALVGIIPPVYAQIVIINSPEFKHVEGGWGLLLLPFLFIIFSLFFIICFASKYNILKKIGAVLSILYSILGIYSFIWLMQNFNGFIQFRFSDLFSFWFMNFYNSLIIMLAGIYYFWKKV